MPHATGTFTLEMRLADGPADPEGLGRFEFDKTFRGDLEGTSRGAMLSAGDPATGSAGYVVVEVVTARFGELAGGFALQHNGTMLAGVPSLSIAVVPGSGTGDLLGIAGTFELTIEDDGTHHYDLDYTVPAD